MQPSKHGKILVGWTIGFFLLANLAYTWAAHGPRIESASVDPLKVRPGDSMIISASVSDPSGISQISMDMGGIETAYFISDAAMDGIARWKHG